MDATERKDWKPTVIYDDQCSVCKILADYARPGASFDLMSWTDVLAGKLLEAPNALIRDRNRLTVISAQQEIIAEEKAWEWLLHEHPKLEKIQWVAEKMHLTPKVAKGMHYLGRFTRMLCSNCR